MKLGPSASHRGGFWIPLRALVLGTALCWGMQAHAQSCGDIYRDIRTAAMYCGFFCDQHVLSPLQVAYEAKCIVQVIPASLLKFELPPDELPMSLVSTEPQSRETSGPFSIRRNSQRLLETVQIVGLAPFVSAARRGSAEAFLNYCKSALAHVPYSGPRVGLTEESASPSGAQVEFARWRLTSIFADCTEAAYAILEAPGVQHEVAGWIKLTQLLEHEEAVRQLSVSAQLSRGRAEKTNIFGTDDWRAIRVFIFEAVVKLLGKY